MALSSRGLHTHCRQRPVSGAMSFSRRDCIASSFDGPTALAEEFIDSSTISGKQGEYQITAPAAWTTQQKAGADILVISPDSKATNVGVTAVPEEFGSTAEVASKLLEAEKKKESTISVDLLASESLTLASGDTAYSFEYDLNSTRGRKRILNLVTISKARLYIVNGQCKCGEDGCPRDVVEQLRRIVSSFKLR